MIPIGRVRELVRYPVKSMAGVTTESAYLGWHGIEGDRRFAFRRVGDNSSFPWLSASRLPDLLRYQPVDNGESTGEPSFTQVRTPAGSQFELRGQALQSEIGEQLGSPVELMELKHGIFDEAAVSLIALATIAGIGRAVGADIDRRRMRANIVLETQDIEPFLEDGWVGGVLLFGEGESIPVVSITTRDVRCSMINLDPDTAAKDAGVMKAVVRLNNNNAGVYGTVVHTGPIQVGQIVRLARQPLH
jgi:uncharacterized protein YcbX